METWVSWAVFLAIAGAAYWYYNQNKPGAAARGRSTTRAPITSSAKNVPQWTDEDAKAKGQRKQAKAKAPRKTVTEAVQEVGNKAEAYLSAASTGGADADDDLSPVTSPKTASVKAPSGKDVSDMLGSKTTAPSILSIKPTEKPGRPAKAQAQKPETPQETKKQRQNKKKNEEARIAREESEKQRQVLLENQRRTAREARGEPSKNGLQAATAPTSSPWTTVASRGAVQPPVSAPSGQLLDTFDAPSTTSSSDVPTNGAHQTPDSLANLSEEEQVRLAIEETAWTTVPKGGKKQRKTANEEILEETRNLSGNEAHAPVKPVRPTQALTENQKASSRYQILAEDFTATTQDEDDWPVV